MSVATAVTTLPKQRKTTAAENTAEERQEGERGPDGSAPFGRILRGRRLPPFRQGCCWGCGYAHRASHDWRYMPAGLWQWMPLRYAKWNVPSTWKRRPAAMSRHDSRTMGSGSSLLGR